MAQDIINTVIVDQIKVSAVPSSDQYIPAITDPVSEVTINGQGDAVVFRYATNTNMDIAIGLTMPTSVFTVTGSPANGQGDFDVTFKSQNANLVLATPDGSQGIPSFRALTITDLPDLSGTYISKVQHDSTLNGDGTATNPLSLAPGIIGTVSSITLASSDFTVTNPTVTTTGTITANLKLSGVTPGTYGTSSSIPVITVNNKGIITSLTTSSIAGSGVGTVTSVSVVSNTLSITGSPITSAGQISAELKTSGVTAGTYGSSTLIPIFTVNDRGIIVDANSISVDSGAGTVTSVGIVSTNNDLSIVNSPITIAGDIDLNLSKTGVVSGKYTNANITIDDRGRITSASDGTNGGVTSIIAGTGISVDTATGDVTVTNDAPDQIVTITGGTDISISGTYPDFTINFTGASGGVTSINAGTGISVDQSTGSVTITNDAPDQVVTLTASTGISITGAYPDFTIENSEPDQIVTLTGGTDISISGTYPDFTIDFTGATGGVTSIIAGTGISVDVSTGNVTVTNSEPDQIVTITAGTGISVTGTYPDFTIDGQEGTVTSVGLTSLNNSIAIQNSPITNSGDIDIGLPLTGVLAGSYVSASITVDEYGRIISANDGGDGTVTSVGLTSTLGTITITNSPITSSGDIDIDLPETGVVAGSYVAADITVDVYGRITSAADSTFPIPLNGTTGQVLTYDNSNQLVWVYSDGGTW
jgi:hypothetical protein